MTGAGGNQVVKLTQEELETLRRTLEEQEVLLKGYQVENEGAVRSQLSPPTCRVMRLFLFFLDTTLVTLTLCLPLTLT